MHLVSASAILGTLSVAAIAAASGVQSSHSKHTFNTAKVDRGNIQRVLSTTGALQAVVTAKVGSQLSGQIEELYVNFNDRVERGQPMARLDSKNYKAKLRAAEAALEASKARVRMAMASLERSESEVTRASKFVRVVTARVESMRIRCQRLRTIWTRKQKLGDRGAVGRVQVDDAVSLLESGEADLRSAEAELSAAESSVQSFEAMARMAHADLILANANVRQLSAAVDLARADLSNTVIRSSIDGIVIGRDVEVGQTVAATLEAPTLFIVAQDLQNMEVHARVDEADIGRVRVGQTASFTVDAFPGRMFPARIKQIRKAPLLIQNVVTYTVVLEAENTGAMLLPGMTAMVQITTQEAQNVLKVPLAALRFRHPGRPGKSHAATSGSPVVWTVGKHGDPAPVPVKLGLSDNSAVEITSGLEPGSSVIIGAISAGGSLWTTWPWRL